MNNINRDILIATLRTSLMSSQDVCSNLGVTKSRLAKIKELEAVVRGFYLVLDVTEYMGNEKIQERRLKHGTVRQ